jgi:hypothetical protein
LTEPVPVREHGADVVIDRYPVFIPGLELVLRSMKSNET